MSKVSRRAFLGSAAALANSRLAHGATPIRIGCISALTGAQEVLGGPILTGAMIAAEQINARGGLLGRPVEIIAADAHADPATAVEWVKTLGRDGINLLCGCVTSDLALAVASQLQPSNAVMITCSAQTEKLTHEAFVPNIFRVTDHAYMRNRAQALLVAQRNPSVTRWAAILPDTEYGRSAWAAFREGLMEEAASAGTLPPDLTSPVLARFGETNFRAQITALKALQPQGLFIAVYGDDGIYFYQQADRAGLLTMASVLADPINEFLVPQTLGHDTPSNLWLAMSWYYGGYQALPMGRQLYVDQLRRTGNSLPLGFLNAGHSAVYGYAAAIAKARTTDTAAIIPALSGLRFDTAKGPVTFRTEDHQAICDLNFIRIKSSSASISMDISDGHRPDIEVAEFIRLDGSNSIEPPTPGQALTYRFPL